MPHILDLKSSEKATKDLFCETGDNLYYEGYCNDLGKMFDAKSLDEAMAIAHEQARKVLEGGAHPLKAFEAMSKRFIQHTP